MGRIAGTAIAFVAAFAVAIAQAQTLRKEASRVRIDPPPNVVAPAVDFGVERYLNIGRVTAPQWSPSGRWIA